MKCLRCGYCCIKYDVIIIDPKYINTELNFEDISIQEKLMIKKSNTWCPHLEENNKHTFNCKVHNKPWYNMTPCFEFGQIEQSKLDKCRTGNYVSKNEKFKEHLRSLK